MPLKFFALKFFARSLPQEAERMVREDLSAIKEARLISMHQVLPPDEENTLLEALAGILNHHAV
jgi:uncharacterized protein HemY